MAIDNARVQALCFDVDGTLSDTDDRWVARLTRLLHPVRGVLPGRDPARLARFWVMGLETPGNLAYHVLDRFGFDSFVARVFNQIARMSHRPKKDFWIIPGVTECLAELSKRFPMAIVSARGHKGTYAFLEQFDLLPYFKAVATAQTCRFTKPFPDPILWAAQKMNVSPHACLMVGDTSVDIKAGIAAGAQTVGVLCGFGTAKELTKAGAGCLLLKTPDILACLDPNS